MAAVKKQKLGPVEIDLEAEIASAEAELNGIVARQVDKSNEAGKITEALRKQMNETQQRFQEELNALEADRIAAVGVVRHLRRYLPQPLAPGAPAGGADPGKAA